MTLVPPLESDPYRLVTIHVEGARQDQLVEEAMLTAARFLDEDLADLYAAEVGNITVTKRSKYRPNLNVRAKPIRWAATIKVRLKPEIVKARRGEKDDPPPNGRHLRPVPEGD